MKKLILSLLLCSACSSSLPKLTPQQQMIVNDLKYEFQGKRLRFGTWKVDTILQIDSVKYGRYHVQVAYDSAGAELSMSAIYLLRLNERSIYLKNISNFK